MVFRRVLVLLCGVLLASGAGVAQVPSEVPREQPTDVPCVIDAQLSNWLALESIDRTIAALETERGALAADLANQLQALYVLERENDFDPESLTEMTVLMKAKAVGRDALENTSARIENRMIDIDNTLTRRRNYRTMLEGQIEAAIEAADVATPRSP